MIAPYLKRLIAGDHLTQAEASALLELMLAEEAADAQIAAVLVALAAKGETEEELAGFAERMRGRCAAVGATRHERFLDTCGTGGSPVKTFNVSTAAACVVSAAGVPVAKHGNVGVTSKAGSADVLHALGVRIDLPPERVTACFDELGLCFMFAPLHHAATKRVAQVRRALGVRTIFNLLGPLTNPAGAPFQLVGVADAAAGERVARALSRLGTRRAWVVRGADGLDEITLADRTVVFEARPEGVGRFEVEPEGFGVARRPIRPLRDGTPEDNARTIRAVLEGERGAEIEAARDLVVINAAAALYVAGVGASLPGVAAVARTMIDTGAALGKLEALRRFTQAPG